MKYLKTVLRILSFDGTIKINYSQAYLPILIMFTVLCTGCGSSGKNSDDTETSKKITIAVIPKGTTHEFWKSVHAGALKASGETGVEIIWKGSLREDDREDQIQIIESFISSRVDAIVLAPLDDRSMVLPVREAKNQGIPTVIIDSGIQEDYHISFVATDNYRGGVLAAEHLGKIMDGTGKVIVLRYQEGSTSNSNRENGFLDTIKSQFPGMEILSDNQYAGPTTETAYRVSENVINRFGEVEGIFAPNEPVTFGCLRALQERGLAGTVKLVGFDSSETLARALENEEIHGLILQDPVKIGYLGVMTAVKHLRGETVEKRIDTGIAVATPENRNEPEISRLLYLDISE
ncbi:substrate-binding domain-containing protein [Candidatus Latescibacterota bacterium]